MELKRILIVEDDADIAAIERDYLELGGYAVTIAPDGTTGLDAALHQPFDLILLDIMLPGLDGYELLDAMCGISSGLPRQELPREETEYYQYNP